MSINNNILLQIKLAIAIALADNEFVHSEEKTIKKWFDKEIAAEGERTQNNLKKELDKELKSISELVKSNQLGLEYIYYEINSINNKHLKYQAMDLAIEVMVADSTIHPKEVALIHEIVEELNLDGATAKKHILKQILKMEKPPKTIDIEGLLKINPSVSNKASRNIIQKEFARWVSATVTSDEKQKEYSQKMIDIISKVRERYA
jgi:hypothetical protein